MQRRKLGLGGSLAFSCSIGLAIVGACNVYDSSLLTGGSEGQGGSSDGGEGSGGDSGTGGGGKGGTQGGGTGGTSDTGGTGGSGDTGGTGGTDPTGGTGTGGSGDTGGTTGGTGKGGTSPTGGDAGDTSTGGSAGSGAGSGGKAGAGSGGDGGSGGSAGNGGSGGACGKCGCGKADTPDTDGDGVLDCIDMCANLNDAHCSVLRSGLVHRYSFTGAAALTAVMDTKGTAHGTAMGVNAGLSGNGTIVLAGGISPQSSDPNKQYVDLPDNILSGLTNATFEAWVTWTTPTTWQRVFDFGSAATGTTGAYVFLTLRVSSAGGCRTAISTSGPAGETTAGGAQVSGPVITTAVAHHFVFSIDDTGNTASLHVDGTLGSTVGFTGTIASIVGTNNWLGRSNYTTAADPYLGGTIDEFRIYNVALTPAQLQTSGAAGPNATLF